MKAFVDDIEEVGFYVFRGMVARHKIAEALKLIHRHILSYGVEQKRFKEFLETSSWFPELRERPEIIELLHAVPAQLTQGLMCDPQILAHFPDDEDFPIVPHKDVEPEWAEGKKYLLILGIALTEQNGINGGLQVWPFGEDYPKTVKMSPGDLIAFHPELMHSSGFNRSGVPRWAVYFRFLESNENLLRPNNPSRGN